MNLVKAVAGIGLIGFGVMLFAGAVTGMVRKRQWASREEPRPESLLEYRISHPQTWPAPDPSGWTIP